MLAISIIPFSFEFQEFTIRSPAFIWILNLSCIRLHRKYLTLNKDNIMFKLGFWIHIQFYNELCLAMIRETTTFQWWTFKSQNTFRQFSLIIFYFFSNYHYFFLFQKEGQEQLAMWSFKVLKLLEFHPKFTSSNLFNYSWTRLRCVSRKIDKSSVYTIYCTVCHIWDIPKNTMILIICHEFGK